MRENNSEGRSLRGKARKRFVMVLFRKCGSSLIEISLNEELLGTALSRRTILYEGREGTKGSLLFSRLLWKRSLLYPTVTVGCCQGLL
jgi:hypothetical protein